MARNMQPGFVDWGEDIAFPMNPVHGMWSFVPGQEVPPGASPDMLNCVVRRSMLVKRPGYTQFPAGASALNGRVVGLYSTQDIDNATHLFAVTPTDVYQYSGSAWGSPLTGPGLTGSNERLFVFETSQNAVVFCQGVDQVMRVPFSGGTYAVLNANCPAAKYLTRAAQRLFLAHTVESAVNKPFRVRRSVAGDHTDWTGVGSGFRDEDEFPYHLTGIRKLHSQLAVYTEGSILLGTRTEDPTAPMRFDPVVTDIGLYLPHTLQGRNDLHYFVGNDDFYTFNAVSSESFGWQIRDQVFPNLNINKLHMGFSAITFDSQEYLAFLCMGASDTPDYVWVYNWGRGVHYPWTVSGPVCASRRRQDAGLTWDDLDVSWDSYAVEWDAAAVQGGYPALLTGHTDGKVYQWGDSNLSDAGSAISCRWTSKDFTAKDLGANQNEQIIMKGVYFRYKETGIETTLSFSFSVDGGASWQGQVDVTLPAGTSAIQAAFASEQVTGNQIRFKMENNTTDETFQIIEFVPIFETPGSWLTAA